MRAVNGPEAGDARDGQGVLAWSPLDGNDELLGAPVRRALAGWSQRDSVRVSPIDPELADTAEFCATYGVTLEESANCVVVAGRRGSQTSYAACMIPATMRVDVNGVVRRFLDARKASFAPMDQAVSLTAMEYGGITPIGLPAGWPVLVAGELLDVGLVVIGSGIRASKLQLPGSALLELPDAQLLPDLAR